MFYGAFDEKTSIAEIKNYSANLYKEYTSLKSKELEELPRFRVMSWHRPIAAVCIALLVQVTLTNAKV